MPQNNYSILATSFQLHWSQSTAIRRCWWRHTESDHASRSKLS